ncbi:hypothetical protein [Burkholderia ubonensis]|uniref:hypothetical protein n=1 Tax=Burkholderia ubonensis TaxID=101571 RepID=UPI000AE74141|nr:hypothetical protein [Burkholderia ubonensis]
MLRCKLSMRISSKAMQLKSSKYNAVSVSGKTTVHRNLSFEEYFSSYTRKNDGAVKVATYSFNKEAFSTIHKLMPFSSFYVSSNHDFAAEQFLRRFPLYVVYIVEGLHTKCVYFEGSRRILIGSQNLFSPTSKFEELSCEIELAPEIADEVCRLAFDFRKSEYLRVKYNASDIRIYGRDVPGVTGRPYLPCHEETAYWTAIGEHDYTDDSPTNHYIYVILEYVVQAESIYLSFDRHYQFCGEITADAFTFLRMRFKVEGQGYAFLPAGGALSSGVPFKDNFAKYHPIARHNAPARAYYVR